MAVVLTGTKETIFDIAVKLFSEEGFDTINMRQIGEASNITAASIYNHFSSKQEIIDTIYAYYREHFNDNLMPIDKIRSIIETGTKEEIMNAFAFTFESSDQKKYVRMVLISKIIYLRTMKDSTASDIFLNLMSLKPEGMLAELLEYGISIGRFEAFDTKTFASILTGHRHIMGVKAFLNPEYRVSQLEEEAKAIQMIGSLLPIKK